jgi:GNAT superfamily N-acetyltransferase
MNNITVKEVQTNSELNKFISFPNKLYKGNKFRVPQLYGFEKSTLVAKKNPAFEFCTAKYWLAFIDGKVVGRIAGIINKKSNEIWNEKMVRFGWIDFIDDLNVSAALTKAVEDWGKSQGMTSMHGPLGFSDMDLEGMLVDGFDELGTQAVIYNYPYYPDHFEKMGYTKGVDWVQKEIVVPDKVPEKLQRFAKLIAEKYQLEPLKVKKAKQLIPYAKSMFYTLNAAFKDLYGFVPLTDHQIDYYIKQYFSIIKPEYVCFVIDKNSEVVGFGISMPSLSKALIKAKGKLFPYGFIPVLKSIYGKNDMIDMYLNGVRPDYHGKGIHAIYYAELMQAYIDNGIKLAITNPQMEENAKALQLWKHYEHRDHIRRRCYTKEI